MQLEKIEGEDDQEKEEEKVDPLKKYAGHDKDLMECYKFIIEGRFSSMREWFQKHTDEEKKKDESVSKVTKLGKCIKTLFIYGSVGVLFSLVAYGQYTAYVQVHGSPFDAKTASTEEPVTETVVKPDEQVTEPIKEKGEKKYTSKKKKDKAKKEKKEEENDEDFMDENP